MSDSPSDFSEKPQKHLPVSVLAGVGFILLFVLILYLAYLPLRSEGPDQVRMQERYEIRRQVDAAAQRVPGRLEAADPSGERFIIPLEDAGRLVVSEFRDLQLRYGITQEGIPASSNP